MKTNRISTNKQHQRKAYRYPNQAEPGYRIKKFGEALLTLISSAGIATLLLFFILL